jgi:hypothetical protein
MMIANKVFKDHAQYLNDIHGICFPSLGESEASTWSNPSEPFCDGFVLWCLTTDLLMNAQNEISGFIQLIRMAFEGAHFVIKYTRSGKCTNDDQEKYFGKMPMLHEYMLSDSSFIACYIAIKVSWKAHAVFDHAYDVISSIIPTLIDKGIVLHDLDISLDCAGISDRFVITRFLQTRAINQSQIVKDCQSVGNNCISWYDTTGEDNVPIRTKVYNKFVQMLESSDIRSSLGTQLANFVANPCAEFTRKLLQYKDSGMTRFEITFYTPNLYPVEGYKGVLFETYAVMQQCPAYNVPFALQWSAIIERLKQMCAVYVENKNTFAYCHWWNSMTQRLHGTSTRNVSPEKLVDLLANFSFNARPITCIFVNASDNAYDVTNIKHYSRLDGCSAITYTAGGRNSLLNPSRAQFTTSTLLPSFASVGLVPYDNITIEWPMNHSRARITDIYEVRDFESTDDTLREIQNTMFVTVADYLHLTIGCSYSVVAYGHAMYRSKAYLCIVLSDGSKVRCTTSGLCETIVRSIETKRQFSFVVNAVNKGYRNRNVLVSIL